MVRLRSLLSRSLLLRTFAYVGGLWSFLPLDDFEFHWIAFLQALVALARNRAVVDKHVGPVIASDEPIAFCIVEPLYGAFQPIHVPLLGLCVLLPRNPNFQTIF